MYVVHTESLDVYRNLAIEEFLLDHVAELGPVLYFWRSDDAVVIGKNQNPWREVSVPLVLNQDCALARRLSGGGAVYHDQGNLNYSLVLPRAQYDVKKQFDAVCHGLRSVGATAQRMGKNSLVVDGRKISGNAFCFRRGGAMHHGTILVATDLERMQRCLRADESAIETHAIRSQPAPVMNLSELDSSLTVDRVADALSGSFGRMLGSAPREMIEELLDDEAIQSLAAKYASWDWVYGLTPSFSVNTKKSLNELEVELVGDINKGILNNMRIVVRNNGGDVVTDTEIMDVRFEREELIGRFQPLAAALGETAPGDVADLVLSA